MSRTPARVTQADIARVLRAVKSAGIIARVDVRRDGTISIVSGEPDAESPVEAPDREDEPVIL